MTNFTHHLTALLVGMSTLGLSGCVFNSDPLPEMPYHPRAVPPEQPKKEEPVQTTTWEEAAAPSPYITTSAPAQSTSGAPAKVPAVPPAPHVVPAVVTSPPPAAPESAATPTPTDAPTPAEQPAQPSVINLPPPSAETPPAVPPAPAAPGASAAPDLKQVTNTGPIPTAARVEGDPTRVWNPLDPSKKIRIINPKTNQPYPSGKKLKVRGTNYQFYVP